MKNEDRYKKTDPEFIVVEEDAQYKKGLSFPEPEGIIWGIFILFSGILLLLNVFKVVPWDIWSYMLRFWPVLIIIAGFQIILGFHIIARIILSVIIVLLFSSVILISLDTVSPSVLRSVPEYLLYPIKWWEVIQS